MVFGIKKISIGILLGMISIIFFGYSLTHAQTAEDLDVFGASLNELDIDLSMTPENPGPLEDVRFYLDSNLVDLNRYRISWFVNGVAARNGIGAREFITKTGAYGTTSTVQVALEINGKVLRKSATLAPRDITILWEAVDSYVPPFYPGKKLPGRESLIKVSVNPYQESGGSQPAPEQGIYVWERNGVPIATSSGYGKSSFTFRNNRIRGSETIAVNVSDVRNSVAGLGQITIPMRDPLILFYEQDVVTGLTHPSVKRSLVMSESKKTVLAEPYFFSSSEIGGLNLTMKWSMNGQPLVTSGKSVTFQNPGSTGTTQVGLTVENPIQTLQSGSAQMTILFKN